VAPKPKYCREFPGTLTQSREPGNPAHELDVSCERFRPASRATRERYNRRMDVKRLLNVGGGNRGIPLPPVYQGWEHILLDIDPKGGPDLVCDARELTALPPGQYDAVYCSHNLEHYYRHDVPRVLAGFRHVLKEDGFAEIRVPDLADLMQTVVRRGLDVDDLLYQSPAGPITVRDVLYGLGVEIERSGNDFWAHKTGFTKKSLTAMLVRCGFPIVYNGTGNFEVAAFAFKGPPTEEIRLLLNLPPAAGPEISKYA
jgi:Methyltransferase domain